MKPQDVRNIAKIRGVHLGRHSTTELIKTLQVEEALRELCGGLQPAVQ